MNGIRAAYPARPAMVVFDWISGEQILVRTLKTEGPEVGTETMQFITGKTGTGAEIGIQLASAPLTPFKFVTHIAKAKSGLPIRGGLARAAGYAYLFKNYVFKDWVVYAEIFGKGYALAIRRRRRCRIPAALERGHHRHRPLGDYPGIDADNLSRMTCAPRPSFTKG